ncbi:MAG: retroviral-like aspartic protease family protein [Algicola sp.]|nr:retroviral-like aspartic protease family protein [Algicola sp.]
MSRFSALLLVLLTCSLSFNVYLYFVMAIVQALPGTAQPIVAQPASTSKSSLTGKVVDDEQSSQAEYQSVSAKQANTLFDQLLFEQAVAIYEELLLVNEQAAIGVKRRWHELVQQWFKDKDYQTVEAFNAAFLLNYPYDLTFLAIKAETLAATDNTIESINIYHSLVSYTFDIRQEEYFGARIHHLASEQMSTFKKSLSWQAIVDFAEEVLLVEADYPPYILAQAEAYIYLGDFDSAERLLEPMLDISFYREQAQSLLAQIHKTKLQQTAVKLQPIGEHYLVSGLINETSDIKLMIDTGASLSVLTRARFDEIENWTSPLYMGDTLLNTAGGQINAPIYQFERYQINDFYVDKISFVIIDLDNMTDYHGLLGMNFLKQFKFEIDQQNNLLILSP